MAITRGALVQARSGRLDYEGLVAILAHELGHYADGDTRLALPVQWLTVPIGRQPGLCAC